MIISSCARPIATSTLAGLLIVGLPAMPSLAAAPAPVFTSGTDYAFPDQDVIAHGDINGDGHQDLVTIDQGDPSVSVMLGVGDGTFALPTSTRKLNSPPGYVAAGDLDKDGRDDVVVIGEDGMLGVLLGLADGGLAAPVDYASGAAGKGVALGDVNDDGNLDAVTTSYLVNPGDPALSVLLGNGDGTFQNAVGYTESYGVNAGWLGLADLDLDGDLDAVTSGTVDGMLIWPNKGDGTYDDPEWSSSGGPVRDLALGDLNGDGYPDVAFTQLTGIGGDGFPRVALNDISGLFGPDTTVAAGLGSFGISLGDLNGDGKQDLVTSLSAGGIDVFTGDGAGTFDAPLTLSTPVDAQTQVVADLNGDGVLDIAGVNKPSVTVFLNAAAPTVTSVTPVKGPLEGGTPITIKGTGFLPGTTVTVGGVPATEVTVVDGATITARTPAGPAGPADIAVIRTDTQTATLPGGFTYEVKVNPAPTVTSVAPAKGPQEGGTPITIKGSEFLAGTTVTVAGAPATDVTVVDGTTITARTPAGPAGPADVTVTRTDTQTATLPGGFIYEVKVTPTPTPTPSPTVLKQKPLKPLNLPARLKNAGTTRIVRVPVRTNAGQNARVSVLGSQALGEVRVFRVYRRDGKVWVELSGTAAMRVKVRIHAPKVPGYTAYTKTKVYRTKAVR
jgi:hypothetical protein